MITLDNYESYLFLYQEGELDSSTCLEVERFLMEHPDIREEMEAYYDPSLVVTAEPPTARQHRRPAWVWAAAACLAGVLVGGTFLFVGPSETEGPTVASVTPTPRVTQAVPAQQPTMPTQAPTAQPLQPSSPRSAVAPIDNKRMPPEPAPIPSAAAIEMAVLPMAAEAMEQPLLAEAEPLPQPDVVECQGLAEVRDVVLVDNLAREVAGGREAHQSVILHLAMNARRNIANSRQAIRDFLRYELFADPSSKDLAEATIISNE